MSKAALKLRGARCDDGKGRMMTVSPQDPAPAGCTRSGETDGVRSSAIAGDDVKGVRGHAQPPTSMWSVTSL